VVSEEFSELLSVGGVFVETELEVLGELFIELLVVIGVFSDFSEKFHALLDDVLLDDLEDLVLLEEFSGNVQGQIFRVDDTLNETEEFGDKFVTVVHNEDSSNVQLDVVLLLLGLDQLERSSLGDIEDGLELQLTFDGEVLDGKMVFPIVGEGFIEGRVLFLGDGFWLSHPDGLGLVETFVLSGDFLDLLLLLVFLLLFFRDVDFVFLLVLLVFRFFFIVRDFLFVGLFDEELDGETNELRVLLDDVLDSSLFEEFEVVALELEDDSGTSLELDGVIIVVVDGEGTSGSGFPSP
jgi:hypothetical protein